MENPPDERAEIRTALRKIIGNDIAWVSAADTQAHFDPITFAAGDAGLLFLAYITGAATKLGEKSGDAILKRVLAIFTTAKYEEQLEQIGGADQVLGLLASELSDNYFQEFIAAGRQSIEHKLIADNFPEEKAKRIAGDIAKFIEGRAKRGKSRLFSHRPC